MTSEKSSICSIKNDITSPPPVEGAGGRSYATLQKEANKLLIINYLCSL